MCKVHSCEKFYDLTILEHIPWWNLAGSRCACAAFNMCSGTIDIVCFVYEYYSMKIYATHYDSFQCSGSCSFILIIEISSS